MKIKIADKHVETYDLGYSVLPNGMTSLTHRNPAFLSTLIRYGEGLQDAISQGLLEILSPEVIAYFEVRRCYYAGYPIKLER